MTGFTVVHPGGFSTLQDLGRSAWIDQGVAVSGAADRGAHSLALRLCGTPADQATVEVLMGGLALRCTEPCIMAVTGATVDVLVEGADGRRVHGINHAFVVHRDSLVTLGRPANGLRSYIAVRGGFDVTPVLGSRSFDTLGALGPAPLAVGAEIAIGQAVDSEPWFDVAPLMPTAQIPTLALAPGPHDQLLSAAAWQQLTSTVWTIDPASNRIGVRLTGPWLPIDPIDPPSFPIVPGCLQLPGNGLPIVLGPDAGVTGGYPVLGVIDRRGQDALSQIRPGGNVRFRRAHP